MCIGIQGLLAALAPLATLFLPLRGVVAPLFRGRSLRRASAVWRSLLPRAATVAISLAPRGYCAAISLALAPVSCADLAYAAAAAMDGSRGCERASASNPRKSCHSMTCRVSGTG